MLFDLFLPEKTHLPSCATCIKLPSNISTMTVSMLEMFSEQENMCKPRDMLDPILLSRYRRRARSHSQLLRLEVCYTLIQEKAIQMVKTNPLNRKRSHNFTVLWLLKY